MISTPASCPTLAWPTQNWPTLNWKELSLHIQNIATDLGQTSDLLELKETFFVERIFVPERSYFPDTYLKGEFMIQLSGRRREAYLYVSIRPRHPGIALISGKKPRASVAATKSPFDLSLPKHLKGSRLLGIEALSRERTVILWFSGENKENAPSEANLKYGLVLVMIPAVPEALLVEKKGLSDSLKILARSRTLRMDDSSSSVYIPPDGNQAPLDPPVRHATFKGWAERLEKDLQSEAFLTRWTRVEKAFKQTLKQTSDRMRQSKTAVQEASREPDWQKWANLLKASLWQLQQAQLSGTPLEIQDYETGEKIRIPDFLKFREDQPPQEQIEKLYAQAKRKQRRIQEAQSRLDRFEETYARVSAALANKPQFLDWKSLGEMEAIVGISTPSPMSSSGGQKKNEKNREKWLGKSFISSDGLIIRVGRSKDENLELFKLARGNDLWMHVRGKPGAHGVIPTQPGKSIPLATLLDAALLVIHYSGGSNWGTTEVDYTSRKYVKRIRNSTEVSYSNNKTLLIQPNEARLKILLGQ